METSTQNKLKKILLTVEDDAVLRKILKEEFIRENFIVYEAENGDEGLESALTHRPNIILLDLLMPKLDGMTMLKKLRSSSDYGKNVRIIVLTNLDANDKIIKDVIMTQPTYYLIKSNVRLDEIVDKVKEVMKLP